MSADTFVTLLICGLTALGLFIAIEYRRFDKNQLAQNSVQGVQSELEAVRNELLGLKKYSEYLAPSKKALGDALGSLEVHIKREGTHVETIYPAPPAPATPAPPANAAAASPDFADLSTTLAIAKPAPPAPPPAPPSKLVVRFEATYTFGFANPPEVLEIQSGAGGIEIHIDRPALHGAPKLRPLPYAEPGATGKATPSPAQAEVVKKLPELAKTQGASSVLDESVFALLEKKLIQTLAEFLSQQAGVKQVPRISVVYH